MPKRNIIAFSLYGSDPKYINGMVENAALAKTIYPGWEVVIYRPSDSTMGREGFDALLKLGCKFETGTDKNPMLWRFAAEAVEDCDGFIIRDADSRLNVREYAAVQEWIASGKSFHVMRDHPHHNVIINGGMWGGKGGSLGMTELLKEWNDKSENAYGNDQRFLAEKIWPKIKGDVMQHDTFTHHLFPGAKPFPKHDGDRFRFVGEVFEADNKPRHFDWEMRYAEVWK